jgi:hypothetical protein
MHLGIGHAAPLEVGLAASIEATAKDVHIDGDGLRRLDWVDRRHGGAGRRLAEGRGTVVRHRGRDVPSYAA